MPSIKPSNCLSILMNIKISFWKLDLLISIKLAGHSKYMILLNSLSCRPIFSFAKFRSLKTNRTAECISGYLTTLISLALLQFLLNFHLFLTIENHTSFEILGITFHEKPFLSILGRISMVGAILIRRSIYLSFSFHGSLLILITRFIIKNEISSGLRHVLGYIEAVLTTEFASFLDCILDTSVAKSMATLEDSCFCIYSIEEEIANFTKVHYNQESY